MKIIDIIKDPYFKNKKIVQTLICHYLGLTKEKLIMDVEKDISQDIFQKIKASYDDYSINQKPIEYIVGYVEFLGNKFFVDENTLIPRAETEYMIKAVNNYLSDLNEVVSIIDVGTGCGVLGLSAVYFNQSKIKEIFLTDISKPALDIAYKNCQNLFPNADYNIKFIQSDLLQEFKNISFLNKNKLLIVANLPYIPNDTFFSMAEENVQKREPHIAFLGGKDGLDLYRKMFNQIFDMSVFKEFSDILLFMEMMEFQTDILQNEFGNNINFEVVETFHFNIKILKGTIKK